MPFMSLICKQNCILKTLSFLYAKHMQSTCNVYANICKIYSNICKIYANICKIIHFKDQNAKYIQNYMQNYMQKYSKNMQFMSGPYIVYICTICNIYDTGTLLMNAANVVLLPSPSVGHHATVLGNFFKYAWIHSLFRRVAISPPVTWSCNVARATDSAGDVFLTESVSLRFKFFTELIIIRNLQPDTKIFGRLCRGLWVCVPMWLRLWDQSMTICVDRPGNHAERREWLQVKMFYISLRHRSEREAVRGDLAGKWQSHMYPSEDAKRPLAHATRNGKNSNQ